MWAGAASHNGQAARAGRKIVLDLPELGRVSALFGEAARRVTDTRTALRTLAVELEPARAKLADPALAGQIAKTLSTLESPAQLMALGKQLDHQSDDAAQTRRRGELSQQPSANGTPTAIASTRKPPPPNISGLVNGKVPAAKLSSVGDGKKLLTVAAKQFRKMDAAAKAAGIDLTVRSGYRTYAEQAYLYRLYKEGRGNLAAPPGKSTHGLGLSADIVVNGDPRVAPWLRQHAAQFGFVNDVPSEPWHWTYKPK